MRTNRKEFPDLVKRARLKKGETVAAFHKKHDHEVERQK